MSEYITKQQAIDLIDGLETERLKGNIELIYAPAIKGLRALPPAEPQIIRCKDCKWKDGSECVRFAEIRPFPNDFCSRAERRTDG